MSEGNPRLLLIDDDPDDRTLAAIVLKSEFGHIEIQEIPDALSFAQAWARKDFHLIIVEQKLCWAEGLALLGMVKEEWPEVPVILFTRHGSEEISARAARLGVDNYLVKRTGNFLRLPLAVEAALEQSRSHPRSLRRAAPLESLLAEARMGVFSASAGGRLLNADLAFLELLGLDSLEDAGRLDLAPLLAPEEIDGPGVPGPGAPGPGPREAGPSREVRIERADGSPVWLQVIRTVRRDAAGEVRIDGLVEDITERKRDEEEESRRTAHLRRSNEDLQQFAATAGHELQEPVRTMERYARLLQETCAGRLDPAADEIVGHVVGAAHRLQALIADLLSLSRLESLPRTLQSVDAEELLAQVLEDLGAAIAESGAAVSHSPLPALQADRGQMAELLRNLIGNAIKFRGPQPPRIHVSAARTDGQWVFSVHDNGVGIDAAEAESIFLPFKRLRPEVPGTGLGLAVCRQIVERHGGHIWVKSEPGQGSTFYFTLPA